MKIQTALSSETLVPMYQTIRRHIQDHRNFHIHHRMILQSNNKAYIYEVN
jgi:hypothetical protein